MRYRKLILSSVGCAALVALIVYATATTNAEPPGSSTNLSNHSHDHDHAHGGHDHSPEKSTQPVSENPVVIPAPAGGPPPLPTEQPSPPANERSDVQSESNSEIKRDPIPAVSSPNLNSASGSRPGRYACPNERQYPNEVPNGGCSFGNADYGFLESQELQSVETYSSQPQFDGRNYHGSGSPCGYEARRYMAIPCTFSLGSHLNGRQDCSTYHGH